MTQLDVTPDSLDVEPGVFTMSVQELLPLGFDVTNRLAEGQTPISPVVTLEDIDVGTPIALEDAPSITGSVVSQIIRGPDVLEAGHTYRLVLVFGASSTVDIWKTGLTILAVE